MKFTKAIIRPGKYSVPQPGGERSVVEITADRIRHWADTFKRMVVNGLRVYAPWKHRKDAVPQPNELALTDPRNNAGVWEDMWVREDGALVGRVDVPLEKDAELIEKHDPERSLACEPLWKDGLGREYPDAILHVAFDQHPVMPGQAELVDGPANQPSLALSLSLLMAETSPTEVKSEPKSDLAVPAKATGVGMKEVLAALKAVDLVLPDDTTPENLAERIVTAANAIAGKKAAEQGGANGQQPKEQPMPIAMSLDSNPDALKVMSFATGFVRNHYQQRIEALVSTGRLTPAAVSDTIKPLLEGFRLSLDQETGQAMPTELDRVLACLEKLPENATGMLGSKTGKAFDAKSPLSGLRLAFEEPLPDGYVSRDKPTAEEADAIVDQQLAASGRATSKQG